MRPRAITPPSSRRYRGRGPHDGRQPDGEHPERLPGLPRRLMRATGGKEGKALPSLLLRHSPDRYWISEEGQGGGQIGNQIVGVFHPDAEADEIVIDSGGEAARLVHGGVGGAGRMAGETLEIAEAHRLHEELQVVEQGGAALKPPSSSMLTMPPKPLAKAPRASWPGWLARPG